MKIENPQVTLDDEARTTVGEGGLRSGFIDYLYQFSLIGDDGEPYHINGSILSMTDEKLDFTVMTLSKGKGGEHQLPNSIYKIGRYPGALFEKHVHNPAGTLKIDKQEHQVIIDCGKEFHVECYEDNSWRFILDSGDGEFKANLHHKVYGGPLWYGRETPVHLTQHSVTYGYNWAGTVEGTIWFKGKEIKVTGKGFRERYVALDSSPAEVGGWEDWGWISFDEIHSSMYEFRLGMKDFAAYDLETKKYYPEGEMTIEHEDWVFLREIDRFIPSVYKVTIKTEDGVYAMKAHVCNVITWGVTHKVPSYPVATIYYDDVEGSFTYNDGSVKVLHGGMGSMSVRQWCPYPNILPRELYVDENETTSGFSTL